MEEVTRRSYNCESRPLGGKLSRQTVKSLETRLDLYHLLQESEDEYLVRILC